MCFTDTLVNSNVVDSVPVSTIVDIHTLHSRLGHASVSKMKHLNACNSSFLDSFLCNTCQLSK